MVRLFVRARLCTRPQTLSSCLFDISAHRFTCRDKRKHRERLHFWTIFYACSRGLSQVIEEGPCFFSAPGANCSAHIEATETMEDVNLTRIYDPCFCVLTPALSLSHHVNSAAGVKKRTQLVDSSVHRSPPVESIPPQHVSPVDRARLYRAAGCVALLRSHLDTGYTCEANIHYYTIMARQGYWHFATTADQIPRDHQFLLHCPQGRWTQADAATSSCHSKVASAAGTFTSPSTSLHAKEDHLSEDILDAVSTSDCESCHHNPSSSRMVSPQNSGKYRGVPGRLPTHHDVLEPSVCTQCTRADYSCCESAEQLCIDMSGCGCEAAERDGSCGSQQFEAAITDCAQSRLHEQSRTTYMGAATEDARVSGADQSTPAQPLAPQLQAHAQSQQATPPRYPEEATSVAAEAPQVPQSHAAQPRHDSFAGAPSTPDHSSGECSETCPPHRIFVLQPEDASKGIKVATQTVCLSKLETQASGGSQQHRIALFTALWCEPLRIL